MLCVVIIKILLNSKNLICYIIKNGYIQIIYLANDNISIYIFYLVTEW